ncbi:FadR/GntR family transcriptional regulator [Fulvimarina sp. 2208YS6-2-32]|uniref:FadR/GntR family transcriptional regulator n=1 Tax=Fulvimarina uroteuthidis TaxID=3098149 RepID=A0ABU5I651_9HYPH|nr:FadR/GntR family transcriptional regulator [Fulvimarina sp. 2208YS6-2-32]MDY8110228.1 FadR/GntR family transcriptional regulator [Fulvimarina sp. 2208YS6-2-32]
MGLLDQTLNGSTTRTSHALVVRDLGRQIVVGTFPPGSILPNDKELSLRFGVSRTVLREAMKTLAAKHLIEPKARVGTTVLDPVRWNLLDADVLRWRVEDGLDAVFLADLTTMRRAFEPEAAALAARRATSGAIAELYAIADRLSDPHHDPSSLAEVDLEFHLRVADASLNPFMRSFTSLIEAALAISFKTSSPALTAEGLAECAVNHRRIVEAIEDRNEAAAREAMIRVIDYGASRASKVLARKA